MKSGKKEAYDKHQIKFKCNRLRLLVCPLKNMSISSSGTESDGDIEDYILCIIVSDQCEQIVKNIGCYLARCKLHLSLDCIGAIDGIDVQKGSSEDISNKHVLTRINFANVRCTRGGQKK